MVDKEIMTDGVHKVQTFRTTQSLVPVERAIHICTLS